MQGRYRQFSLDAGYWFQDRNKRAVDRAYLGYRFDLQVGAPARPFGLLPYPQFGWSYHIPFFLGFGVNTGTGLKYGYKDSDWDFQAAYYPRMLPSSIRYAPEVGRYADLKDNAIPALHGRQDNEKRDQVNLRLARSFQAGDWNNEVGASLAASRLYNATTDDNGSFWAAGAHGVFKNGPWTISSQAIRYEYDPKNPSGVSDDSVLMGGNGLTPAFLVAAKGSIGGLNVGYDVATPWLGPVKKVKLYNDYSRLWKDKSGWDDSQMYTAGIQFFALPVMAWLDLQRQPLGRRGERHGLDLDHLLGQQRLVLPHQPEHRLLLLTGSGARPAPGPAGAQNRSASRAWRCTSSRSRFSR